MMIGPILLCRPAPIPALATPNTKKMWTEYTEQMNWEGSSKPESQKFLEMGKACMKSDYILTYSRFQTKGRALELDK